MRLISSNHKSIYCHRHCLHVYLLEKLNMVRLISSNHKSVHCHRHCLHAYLREKDTTCIICARWQSIYTNFSKFLIWRRMTKIKVNKIRQKIAKFTASHWCPVTLYPGPEVPKLENAVRRTSKASEIGNLWWPWTRNPFMQLSNLTDSSISQFWTKENFIQPSPWAKAAVSI